MDVPGEGEIRGFLVERIAAKLPGGEVDPDRPLEEYGLSSRDAVAIAGELAELLGRDLSPTLVWAHPTVNELARALTSPATAARAEAPAAGDEPIAVVGVGCRVPGAHGPEEFWRLLMDGRDAIGVVPEGRWEAFDDGSARTEEALAGTTRHGGFLADVAGFDTEFFGIAPGEAASMDPQHRLLLETAWEALEHGGIAPRSLRGSRTGAFVGISGNEYAYLTTADPARVDAWTATGAAFCIAANRLSYLLDLRGPSLAVDTACSSSLVATHLAVRSLRSGESDLAIAAGVNLLLSPVITMAFDRGGGTAPDGRCKTFDASADGMVRAEGCGVVVLKRLPDAVRDGDRVLAVITATGVNQDGRSNGLVAPNPEAQESLLREVHAGLPAPAYIEAHGTGTYLGDPIEAAAIAEAFQNADILIGSAKSNIGHLEAAAGVTALIKTVLALHHGVIPPNIHFKDPNPHIPWTHLTVVTAPTPWPHPNAGVSSFGFGGTNAHIALTTPPNLPTSPGPPWSPGVPGPLGPLWSPGLPAPPSPPGSPGVPGPLGSPGVPAPPSPPGSPGVPGSPGSPGVPDPLGQPGSPGSPGVLGSPGSVASRGGIGPFAPAAPLGPVAPLGAARSVPLVADSKRRVGEEGDGGVRRNACGGGAKHVFLVTDTTADRVRDHADLLAGWVMGSGTALPDVAYTLARRAGRGKVAAAVVAGSAAELAEGLRSARPASVPPAAKGPVWVFSGYGGQWPAMGRHLYETEPAYREALDELAPLLNAEARLNPWTVPEGVAQAQPLIFATQIALARLWQAYGFQPAAVIGHSMGEVAAATVAGGLSLHDAVRVVCRRARLLATLTSSGGGAAGGRGGGAMALVEVVAEEVPGDLHVAVYASPRQVVVTGEAERVAAFVADIAADGRMARMLTAEGAGHSPQVKPLLPLIRDELAAVGGGKPALPYYSTVLDDPREVPVFEAAYWAAGVRRPVRLMQAVRAAAEDGFNVFTEIGPHPLLASALRDTLGAPALVTYSLRRDSDGDFHTQVATVAAAIAPRTAGRVVDVPCSPWRHERHWVAPHRRTSGHRLLGAHVETPAGHAWSTTLDDLADAPWRLEPAVWHRHGHPVLPVAAVARLAHAAVMEVYGEAELSDATLHALLPLPAQITVTLEGKEIRVAAKNAAGAWKVYGTATLTPSGTLSRDDLAAPGDTLGLDGSAALPFCGSPDRGSDTRGAHPSGWLERVRHVRADGTLDGVELKDLPADVVPVPLEAKLVERVWIPAPLAGEALDPGIREVVVVPAKLDTAATQEFVLRIADLAQRVNRLTIVTQGAQAVLEGESADPGPASLRGLVRVLAFEHPELRACLVDVDDLAVLDRELAHDGDEDEVAWRNGTRYAARLRRASLPPLGKAAVAGPGAYVITGGYGRLGLVVARWLAARGATRIVLNGRSTPPPERLTGLPVVVVTGDLADEGTAERLVSAATEGGLRLRGVVHAAGVLDDRLVADLDAESMHRVWTAKAEGGLRLHEATREADWWVAFSSAAALLGSPGQAAYATTNAWLDALCDMRRAAGRAAISVNWGAWTGAAALPAVEALTEEEGIEALEALLRCDRSAGVVRLDADAAVTIFPGIAGMPYFSEVVGAVASVELPDDVPGRVRARAAAVLGVDAAWLDDGTVLTELGLDSLAATRLRGTLEYDFGITVATAPLLRGGTLGELTRTVSTALGLAEEPSSPAIGPRDAAERQAVRVMATLLGHEPSVTDIVPPDLVPVALDLLGREVGSRVVTVGAPEVRVSELADAIRAVDEVEAERGLIRPLNPPARSSLETTPNYPADQKSGPNGQEGGPGGQGGGSGGQGGGSGGQKSGPGGHEGGGPAGREALFLAHPAGGTTGVYGMLAARLGAPVFGLERIDDPGLGIPERAERYAAEIRRFSPGPYRVGGWSFGGIVAFEVARLLGDECELVAMIDSGLPDQVPEAARQEIQARRYVDFAAYLSGTYGVEVRLGLEELLPLDEQGRLDLTERRITESGVLAMLSPAILRHQITSHEDTRAIEHYRPGTFGGRVVLYRSTEPTPWAVEDTRYLHRDDPARGFGPHSPGLEIVEVPGSHHLNLLDPPHVETVAAHLEELL